MLPGTAPLVERPTKKPGTILTRVRVPAAVARDFSPSQFSVLQSYFTAPVCNRMHQHLCSRLKSKALTKQKSMDSF